MFNKIPGKVKMSSTVGKESKRNPRDGGSGFSSRTLITIQLDVLYLNIVEKN